MDAEVVAGQATFRALISLLWTIPGVGDLAAKTILAEMGTDMGRFPTAGHLLAWAGMCPGQNEAPANAGHRACAKAPLWLKTLAVHSTAANAKGARLITP
jgi:transposase